MKKYILLAYLSLFATIANLNSQETQIADEFTIELARMFAKDIFELNGVPYLQPVVQSVNVTANSGFFNQAYIPKKVAKPYFRVSVQSMYGLVPDDFKTYRPQVPSKPFDFNELSKYGTPVIDFQDPSKSTFNIADTAGLIHYVFLVILHDGIQQGRLVPPISAATAMGSGETPIILRNSLLDSLAKELTIPVPIIGNLRIYDLLPENIRRSIDTTIQQFPEAFTLPTGSDMTSIFAAVPQLEIGSLWGTEALIRFIPPVNLGENIGDFMFWGFGLKHSVSQYFYNSSKSSINQQDNPFENIESRDPFQMAVQLVYQGTVLKNEVGLTNSKLEANATIINANIHASYQFKNYFGIYSGLSYDIINISSDYSYSLPVEVQYQLGMLRTGDPDPDPENGFPGDTKPQTTTISLEDTNLRWVIGVVKEFGSFTAYADFNMSVMNIFHAGLAYTF